MINDFHVHMGKTSKGDVATAEDLAKNMDIYDIERSGLSLLNGTSCKELNDEVLSAVKKFPDRIIGYAYINPREKNAIDEVHRCLQNDAFRGVKFHSWKSGYFPDNNTALDRVIDAVSEYDLPILTHTGTPPLALPQQWALVAKRHPNVNFIFAHIGYMDYGYGCVQAAKELKNVYVGTSGQVEVPVIQSALDELGPDKIIFGTDWPYKFVKSEIVKFEAYDISEEDRYKIFYKNAKTLWKI